MPVSSCLCHIGLHRWRSESEAKRYRHNTFWNKTTNRLDPARALMKVCTRCGTKRIWSFNRGKWRKYESQEPVDTSAAWNLEPMPKVDPTVEPVIPSKPAPTVGQPAPTRV